MSYTSENETSGILDPDIIIFPMKTGNRTLYMKIEASNGDFKSLEVTINAVKSASNGELYEKLLKERAKDKEKEDKDFKENNYSITQGLKLIVEELSDTDGLKELLAIKESIGDIVTNPEDREKRTLHAEGATMDLYLLLGFTKIDDNLCTFKGNEFKNLNQALDLLDEYITSLSNNSLTVSDKAKANDS